MPKLSKIRLTGCKYDGLRKEHENSIFDLTKGEKPDHSLFTLKNGGGKGVMMQLIFQLLLPETKWGKNNGNQVIAMFYDKRNNLHPFTFYVVLEWVLDTTPEKRLITGIAVKSIIKNTSSEEEEKTGLSYFLYSYEHDNNGYYTVENLPLYDEKTREAVDIKDFEEFLGDNKRDFIKYSQSNSKRKDSDYYRYLQSRGIHRNEWTILKEINKSEGGISDYFRNASDNKSIFDKVIIPAIVQNIRNYSLEDENSLIEMFKSNLSITKDLPILLKRENDFKELILSIDPLIENADSGVRFIQRGERLIDEGNDIFYILKDEGEIVSDEIEKWKSSHEKAIIEKDELNYKRDNLIYNRERNDYIEKKEEAQKYEKDYNEKITVLDERQEELLLYHINKVFCYKREEEEKIKDTERKRELLIKTLDIEDIKEKIEELDYEIEKEWEDTKIQWKKEEVDYNGYINYTNDIIEEERIKEGKYRNKKEELQNKINKFELEKGILAKKKKLLEEHYDTMSLQFPERILEGLNADREKIIENIEYISSEKEKTEKTIKDIKEERNKLEYSLNYTLKEADEVKERINTGEKRELDLVRDISKALLENYDGSILDKSWFSNKLNRLEKLHISKKKDLEEIQRNIWEKNMEKSLNKEEYFIPNNDVLILKSKIEKLDIHVETGAEFLKDLKESEGQEILRDNPGFIYSLVIGNEGEWNIIEKNMDKDIFIKNMVPIFIRSEMKGNKGNYFRSITGITEKLADKSFYNDWKYGLEDEYVKLLGVKENIDKDISNIDQLKQEINLLLKGEIVFDLNKKLKYLNSLIKEKRDSIIHYEEELSNFENNLKTMEKDLQVSREKLEKIIKRMESLQDYMDYLQEIKEREVLINGVTNELKEINKYILDMEDNIKEVLYRQGNIEKDYNKWKINNEHILNRLKNIYRDAVYEIHIDKNYRASNIPNFSKTNNNLILLVEEREDVERDITGRNAQLAVLDNDLKHFNDNIKRYENDLENIRDNWKDYEDLRLPLIEINIIIKELEKYIKDLEKENLDIKSNLDNLLGRIDTLTKNLDNKEMEILRIHKKAPLILEGEDIPRELNNVNENLKSNKEFVDLCLGQLEDLRKKDVKLELNLSKVSHKVELDFTKGKMDKILKNKILNNTDLVVDNWLNNLNQNQDEINRTKIEGESFIGRFLKGIELKLEEDKLKEKLTRVIREANINNFRSNRDTFKGMKDHFSQELMTLSKDKEKAEEAMKQWTNRASIYVIKMIETLKDMVSSMNYINENNHVFPLVKLKGAERLPKEEEEINYLLEEHFIQSISKVLEQNQNIEKIDNRLIESLVGDSLIFSKALQGRYPILLVYKMTENNEFRYAKAREEHYTTWEAINKGEGVSTEGSGGQTLSVTTFVTMMIMSFKKKHIGNENPSTILLLDNPFGKASGKHVLDPIFEIADKLNFQLICFAAPEIIKMEISERFPIFWELRIENGKVIHGGRIIKD